MKSKISTSQVILLILSLLCLVALVCVAVIPFNKTWLKVVLSVIFAILCAVFITIKIFVLKQKQTNK